MANHEPKPIPAHSQKDIDRFWSKVDKTSGHGPKGDCWIWTDKLDRDGYGKIGIFRDKKVRSIGAHRFSYFLQYGQIPENKPNILHRCDNPPCVNPTHLWAGTNRENQKDCTAKGRRAKGNRNGTHTHPEKVTKGEQVNTAKLTESEVLKIRSLYQQGYVQTALARKYGVNQGTISAIVRRQSWKHI